jgi:hypothetical protein
MIAAALAVFAGLGVIAWYLQRPTPRPIRLSFARLIPDPPEDRQPVPTMALTLPVRSVAFWLHLLAVLAALMAIWLDLRLQWSAPTPTIGLRLVLDASHSMSVRSDADGDTRWSLLQAQAHTEAEAARAAAETNGYCDEVVVVGDSMRTMALQELAQVQPLTETTTPARLLQAADRERTDCAITHVVIITDLPRPALESEPRDQPLRWLQVGQPVANVAVTNIGYTPPRLDGTPAQVTVTVDRFGTVDVPALQITGPGGEARAELRPSAERAGRFVATLPVTAGGAYTARVYDGGGYTGDDIVQFTLDAPDRLAVDWRLEDIPPPRGATSSDTSSLIVMDLSEFASADPTNSVLATYPGWDSAAAGEIGAFVDDPELLSSVNFDVLERWVPSPIPHPLPEGFQAVITDATGGVLAARRTDPPGVIVPAPLLSAQPDVAALSAILFYSGLQDLVDAEERPLDLLWQTPGGTDIANAWRESDTARPLAPSQAAVDYTRPVDVTRDGALFPWLALTALFLLLAERVWTMRRTAR